VTRHADLLADARRTSVKAKLAGTVIRRQERRGRSGDPFAFVGDAVTPARHPLPGVCLPFALLALSRHDAIVPGRRVPSS